MPSKQKSQDKDSDLELDAQPQSHSERTSSRSRVAAPSPAPSNFEANAILFLGFLCLVGGLALSVLPRFSWKASQIMVGMDYLGVHGGAIAMGGLVVMCLGVVRRQIHASSSKGAVDDDLLFEQVAADIVQTRNALELLQSLTDGMQEELSNLSTQVEKLATQQPAAAQPGTGNENALFGLASSLDKLGARLEQRLKKQHDALQSSLDEVTASLEQTRASIEHPAPIPMATESTPHPTEPADGEIDPQSLGLLDELDDYGTAAPLPQESPAESTETANRDALEELRLRLEHDLGTMQSGGGSWEEELDMVEAPTRSKIEQLAALLADGEVRQALEDLHTRR